MSQPPENCKVVITGVQRSGRTAFVFALSEIPYSEPDSKTVAMDFGRITMEDSTVFYLFGAPNGRRFDFMYETMEHSLLGWIIMLDSTRPETFAETNSILLMLMDYPLPIIVVAAFQDKPGAWDAEALQILLHIPNDIPVIPCVATDPSSVKNVLLTFCEHVLEQAEETDLPL